MTGNDPNVKPEKERISFAKEAVTRCVDWLDSHPHTGWYIAAVATLNLFLNLIDAFDLF